MGGHFVTQTEKYKQTSAVGAVRNEMKSPDSRPAASVCNGGGRKRKQNRSTNTLTLTLTLTRLLKGAGRKEQNMTKSNAKQGRRGEYQDVAKWKENATS